MNHFWSAGKRVSAQHLTVMFVSRFIYHKVASNRLVYYSIFNHFGGATKALSFYSFKLH